MKNSFCWKGFDFFDSHNIMNLIMHWDQNEFDASCTVIAVMQLEIIEGRDAKQRKEKRNVHKVISENSLIMFFAIRLSPTGHLLHLFGGTRSKLFIYYPGVSRSTISNEFSERRGRCNFNASLQCPRETCSFVPQQRRFWRTTHQY